MHFTVHDWHPTTAWTDTSDTVFVGTHRRSFSRFLISSADKSKVCCLTSPHLPTFAPHAVQETILSSVSVSPSARSAFSPHLPQRNSTGIGIESIRPYYCALSHFATGSWAEPHTSSVNFLFEALG